MVFNVESLKKAFAAWADIMAANKEELIRLDGIAGDSDLGLTMTDGFAAGSALAQGYDGNDLGMLTYQAGKALMSKAPSSLGTLLGAAFMKAGQFAKGKESVSGEELYLYFDAFQRGIMDRGKAKVGDKTFLDGFDPAVQVFKNAADYADDKALLNAAAAAARAGSDNTANLVAQHGRMAIRGNASLGMIDPGSVVAALMFEGLARA